MSASPLVLYHGNCLDGFTAAWACWKSNPSWEFVASFHGEGIPDVTNRDVLFLDFSYKKSVILELMTKAKSITIIDHHKSAASDLKDLDIETEDNDHLCPIYLYFELDHSGAYLTWKYFHFGEDRPFLIDVIEDYDLGGPWSEEGPRFIDTKPINVAISSYDYTFEQWNLFADKLNTVRGRDALMHEGEVILRKQSKDIDEILRKHKFRLNIGGVEVWTANTPYYLANDAANALCIEDSTFGATFYIDHEQAYVFSLRSKHTGLDVSEIAKLYGGGGHARSAGFRVKSSFFQREDEVVYGLPGSLLKALHG